MVLDGLFVFFAMKYDWLLFDFFFHLILKKEGAGRKKEENQN